MRFLIGFWEAKASLSACPIFCVGGGLNPNLRQCTPEKKEDPESACDVKLKREIMLFSLRVHSTNFRSCKNWKTY
jgi:hypothetical protein